MQVYRALGERGALDFFKERSKKIKSEITWSRQNLDLLDLDLRPRGQQISETRLVSVNDDTNNPFCKWKLIFKDCPEGIGIGIQISHSERTIIKAVCMVKVTRTAHTHFLSSVSSRLLVKVPREYYGATMHLENDLRMSININVVVEMEFLDIEEPKLITKHLGNLMEAEDYADFKFVFPDGRSLKAHKAILAARSDVFKAMFSHNMIENRDNLVKIVDISYDGFKEFLRYIYTEEVRNMDQLFMDIFIAADKYGLDDLKNRCEHKVRIEKAVDDFLAAEEGTEKKSSIMDFIKMNISEIRETEGWKNLNGDTLNEIFMYIFVVNGS